MKNIMALAVVLMSTSLYAIDVDGGNNMGQEPAPNYIRESRTSRMDSPRKMNESSMNYGSEMNDRRFDDSISTGQSSTRRNSMDAPAARPAVTERCIDKAGYSYSKNDSGYAACVNQHNRMMRNR